MRRHATTHSLAFAFAMLALAASGCGGGSADTEKAAGAKGPIKIWYSNNKEELAWGEALVAKWNAAHPKETVTGQEIPAGKTSEEVIGASITAGNAPCLVLNTSPAAAVRASSIVSRSRISPTRRISGSSRKAPRRAAANERV